MFTTRSIKEVSKEDFHRMLQDKEIVISSHAFDHLSQRQRKVFKEEELIHILKKETPRKVCLQENGRFGAYFRKKDGYRKIIIDMQKEKAKIITFMDNLELPRK